LNTWRFTSSNIKNLTSCFVCKHNYIFIYKYKLKITNDLFIQYLTFFLLLSFLIISFLISYFSSYYTYINTYNYIYSNFDNKLLSIILLSLLFILNCILYILIYYFGQNLYNIYYKLVYDSYVVVFKILNYYD
jgi:hypothetical protein